jgi:hypothetical protein
MKRREFITTTAANPLDVCFRGRSRSAELRVRGQLLARAGVLFVYSGLPALL